MQISSAQNPAILSRQPAPATSPEVRDTSPAPPSTAPNPSGNANPSRPGRETTQAVQSVVNIFEGDATAPGGNDSNSRELPAISTRASDNFAQQRDDMNQRLEDSIQDPGLDPIQVLIDDDGVLAGGGRNPNSAQSLSRVVKSVVEGVESLVGLFTGSADGGGGADSQEVSGGQSAQEGRFTNDPAVGEFDGLEHTYPSEQETTPPAETEEPHGGGNGEDHGAAANSNTDNEVTSTQSAVEGNFGTAEEGEFGVSGDAQGTTEEQHNDSTRDPDRQSGADEGSGGGGGPSVTETGPNGIPGSF